MSICERLESKLRETRIRILLLEKKLLDDPMTLSDRKYYTGCLVQSQNEIRNLHDILTGEKVDYDEIEDMYWQMVMEYGK